MDNAFVSICIPVYNGEVWLRECIDSCLGQTYGNYELVICDDRSTDASAALIESYAKEHPKIRFSKNEKNLGLVGNWNRCLSLARGEWIKFVFQDDFISSDCLAEFVNAAKKNDVLLVSERNFILPENASADQLNYYSNVVRTLRNSAARPDDGDPDLYSAGTVSKLAIRHPVMNFIAEPSLTFFKKELVERVGVFDERLKQICDLEFFLRVGSQYGLRYVPKKICAFRIHSASTTSINVSGKFFELRYIEPLLLSFMLLYEKSYTRLREHIGVRGRMKLKIYFKLKAYEAHQASLKNNIEHPVLKEQAYDAILKQKRSSWPIRLLHLLRR
jgi:glycosyltransferase involved in cell wall biosynthesis